MKNNDWLFKNKNTVCNFRTVGVLIKNNKLLVQRDTDGFEYALPGGHVKIGESSIDSLIREYKEETGADIKCNRLLWVEECSWKWNNKQTNTIAFYYQIELCNENSIIDTEKFISQKDKCNVLLGWMPLDKLSEITIYPSFIKEKILDIKPYIEHFITKE